MSNPAWSMDNITWDYFLGAYRYGGRPKTRVREDIVHETDSGVDFVYNLYEKKTFDLTFRVGETELASFETFYEATFGQGVAFYFSLSGSTSDAILVRGDAYFDPVELDGPGGNEPIYDLTMRFREKLV